jgi:integrase
MYKKMLVKDVIRETLAVLERKGYNVSGTRKYNTVYRSLAHFSQLNYEGTYSNEVGEAFMQSLREREKSLSMGFYRSYANAIEYANHVMEGDVTWRPEVKNQNYVDSCYRREVKLHEEYLKNSGKTKSDVRSRMHIVSRFLYHLDDSGVKKLTELTATHIYEAFQAASDKGGFNKSVGAFLRYAHRHSLTNRDYSVLVPQAKRHTPVPTVYTPEEVEKIIEASAMSKRCGKRDYAIVLIAARLGLRSCDITNLRFENIHADTGWI